LKGFAWFVLGEAWRRPRRQREPSRSDVLALEITEELEAALEQFSAIAEDLKR